jgi:ribosomal protein S12 methylthiotransferase
MKPQVPKKVAERRKMLVEEHQTAITERQIDRFVGRVFDVLVEERVEGEDLWLGRLFCQAPEVDGSVVINSDVVLTPGDFVRCKIFARAGFDLEGAVLER